MPQPMLSLVLLTFVTATTNSQTWTGTYTVQPGCSKSSCCCLDGQVTVTRFSADMLNMRSGLTGKCDGQTTYQGNVDDPKGFTGLIRVLWGDLNVTLSSDSRTITLSNPLAPQCNGKALRNGAVKQHLNLGMLLAALVLLQMAMHFLKK